MAEKLIPNDYYYRVNGVDYFQDNLPSLYIKDAVGTNGNVLSISEFANLGDNIFFDTRYDNDTMAYYNKFTLNCKIKYEDPLEDVRWEDNSCTIKAQGDSSLRQNKHNFNIKTSKKRSIRCVESKKAFLLKADNASSYHMTHTFINSWNTVWRMTFELDSPYRTYDSLPDEIKDSLYRGALNMTPTKVYYEDTVNGTMDYLGLYSFGSAKKDYMFCFDSKTNPYGVALAKLLPDNIGRTKFGNGSAFFGGKKPGDFSMLWNGEESALAGSFEFQAGDDDMKTEKIQSINDVISICMEESSDEEFKQALARVFDVTSIFDFLIFRYFMADSDSFKNGMYFTTNCMGTDMTLEDGTVIPADKWHMSFYDFDNAFSGKANWTSANMYSEENDWNPGSHLFNRVFVAFRDDIKARYAQLRESVLKTDVIISAIIDEWQKAAAILPYDTYNNEGELRPVNSTVKFTNALKETQAGFNLIGDTKTEIDIRFAASDEFFNNLENYYPYALVSNIEARDSSYIKCYDSSPLNIYDIVKFEPVSVNSFIKTTPRMQDKVFKNVAEDKNNVISSIASNGDITFSGNNGIAYVEMHTEQMTNNKAQETSRTAMYKGKVASPLMRIDVFRSNATSCEIEIVNGEDKVFSHGKRVYVEAFPNGKVDHYRWTVGDLTVESEEPTFSFRTSPEIKTYTISLEVFTDASSSFTATKSVDSILPEKVLSAGGMNVVTNISGMKYSDTVVEGEFKVDHIHYIASGDSYGNQFIFGSLTSTSTDFGNNYANTAVDGIGLFIQGRRLWDKQIFTIQCYFNNKTSASSGVGSTIKNVNTASTSYNMGIDQFNTDELIYFRLCDDYYQINDKKYPWTVMSKANNTTLKNALRLFAGANGTAAASVGYNDTIKKSIHWMKIWENGILTHDIVPGELDSGVAGKIFTDKKSSSTTFAIRSGNGTGAISTVTYANILAPCVLSGVKYITPIKMLPIEPGCVGFNNSFNDLGVKMTLLNSFKVKFKPAYTPVSSVDDSFRGFIIGQKRYVTNSSTNVTTFALYTRCASGKNFVYFEAYNGGTKQYLKYEYTPRTTYVVKYDYDKTTKRGVIGIYNESETTLLKSETITLTSFTPIESESNLFIGGNPYMKDASSGYMATYTGYVHYLELYDEDKNEIMHLVPDSYSNGFYDTVNENYRVIYPCYGCCDDMSPITIDHIDGDSFEGAELQMTESHGVDLNSTYKYDTLFIQDSTVNSDKSTRYWSCMLNHDGLSSKPRWEVISGEQYAKIDNTGLLKVCPSANNSEITVKAYYMFLEDQYNMHDTYTFNVTYTED